MFLRLNSYKTRFAGKKFLVKPVVQAKHLSEGFEELPSDIDKRLVFPKDDTKIPIIAIDGGGIKGMIPCKQNT